MTRVIPLLLLVSGAQANPVTLVVHSGQWQFTAEREAEVRALAYHKKDKGVSSRCLSAAPLNDLRDWLADKGCTIDVSTATRTGVILHGVCRFRFLPGEVLPMQGEIVLTSADSFKLNLDAGRTGLHYHENTVAERFGPCVEPAKP